MKSNDNYEQANRRARELQARAPRAVSARYDRGTGKIVIHLSSKLIVSFAPEEAQGLENARPSQLSEIEISPSGFGLGTHVSGVLAHYEDQTKDETAPEDEAGIESSETNVPPTSLRKCAS